MQKLNRWLAGAVFLVAFIATFSTQIVADEKQPEAKTELQVTTGSVNNELHLNLHCNNVDATDVLTAISKQGHTAVIINEATSKYLWNFHLENVTPETAIEKVCEAANLNWTVQNQTYIVSRIDSKPLSPAQKPATITTEFADMEVAPMLVFIGEQANIKIVLSTNTFGPKLKYIRLNNETAEGAIQKIALAVGFDWKKLDDNTYSIAKPEKIARR